MTNKELTMEVPPAETPVNYIGPDKVATFVVAEGTDLIGVMFENGKTMDLTTEQWECLKSAKPYGVGEISIRKHEKLMVRILKLMVKARVTLGEHDWILDQVHASVGENYRKSISKLYNVTNTEKIFLADIDEVLKREDNSSEAEPIE